MLKDMRNPNTIRSFLGLIPEGNLEYPLCSMGSRAPCIKGDKMVFLGGKNDGEDVADGKLTPGQIAIIKFGTVMPSTDVFVGVNPALLGVAVVGNPVLLQGSRKERYEFAISVEAKKAINLRELGWHVSVAAVE